MNDTLRQITIVLATIAVLTVNALANILPINGQGSGEISDRIPVFFTPAGYVFSIWSLIYVGLIAYAIFQALPMNQQDPTLRAIAPYYLVASGANFAWIFAWHYERFPITVVLMLILLGSLIMTYLSLDGARDSASTAMKWTVLIPFSIYLGWITVATIANISAMLWLVNWNGFGIAPEIWTAIVLAVAVGIAAMMALTRGDVAYGLVLVWAFFGIYSKHSEVPIVGMSAIIATILVAIMVVLSLFPSGGILPLSRS